MMKYYILVNNKEEYNKAHRILTSFDQQVSIYDKEYMDTKNEIGKFSIRYNDGKVWALYYAEDSETEGLSLVQLYNLLESGILILKPLDFNKDVVEISTQAQAAYIASHLNLSLSGSDWVNSCKEYSEKDTIYIHLRSDWGELGWDLKGTMIRANKNIISFKEFLKRSKITENGKE